MAWLVFWALCIAVTANFHELAHDEAQAWNIARAATLPWQIFELAAYEGHTPVWFLLLWPFALTGDPVWMQVIAALAALATGALLLRDAPFPRAVTVLALFSYFMLYEYAIVPRPYVLGLLFAGIWATLIRRGSGGLVSRTLVCALVASTSSFGLVLSAPLVLVVWLESIGGARREPLARWLVAATLYAASALTTIATVLLPIRPAGYESAVLAGHVFSIGIPLKTLVATTFPHLDRLPGGAGVWMSQSVAGQTLIACIAVLAAVCVTIRLTSRPNALIGWLVSLVAIPFAAAYAGTESERHLGHLFIAALVLCWARDGLRHHASDGFMLSARVRRAADSILVIVLLYHAAIGLAVSAYDVRREMTPMRRAAAAMAPLIGPDTVIVNDYFQFGVPLLAYLDREALDLRCDCYTRHTVQDARWLPPPERLPQRWCELLDAGSQVIVLTARREMAEADGAVLLADYPTGPRDRGTGNVLVVEAANPSTLCATTD